MLVADSVKPLYLQLEEVLRQEIIDGHWQEGAKIPTENDLIAQYGVSRVTVRRAVAGLVSEGRLIRHSGKGTFVSGIVMRNDVNMPQGWTETMRAQGCEPATDCIALITVDGARIEAAYGISGYHNAFYRRATRIRSLNGRPLVYEIDYFPSPAYDFLTKEKLCGSVFEVLRQERQLVHIYEKESVIRVVKTDQETAEMLAVKTGEVVVHALTIYLDEAGQIVLLNKQYINSEKYEIRTGGHRLVLAD